MSCAKGAVHTLPEKKGINEKTAIRVVNAYLKGEVYTGRKKLDFKRVHHYLMDLAPCAEEPDIPKPDLPGNTEVGRVVWADDPADQTAEAAGASSDEDPYAQFSELFVKSPDDDAFTTMLKTMACKFAGRELEDPDEEENAEDYDAFEDEVDPEELRDEASVFHAFQKRMRDPRYAAVIEELAKRAAAGPANKQKSAEDDDGWDEEDVSLIPPGEYESFLASQGMTTKSAQPRHVHNTKRKGLSRKKDKNRRKKKK